MKEYFADLCRHLRDSFSAEERNISIEYDIRVDLFDVETAIPLGLIVNELITNSIAYAFADRDKGAIEVKLWQDVDQKLCLSVTDDGLGHSTPINNQAQSFGTDLVKILRQKIER